MSNRTRLPSIWIGSYDSYQTYVAETRRIEQARAIIDGIDDHLLHSRKPFQIKAWCAQCNTVRLMHIDWSLGGIGANGSVAPAWTETVICEECGLNSRMRALVDYLLAQCNRRFKSAYVAEGFTPGYIALKHHFHDIVGSEYFGPDCFPGQKVIPRIGAPAIRHEDLTRLSFVDRSFDLVVTQDVFEHIPDYRKAFSEIARVLCPGGMLVFTIPFFPDLGETRIRACVGSDGGIEHLLPAEYHGNPVSTQGSLCFQHFGWDILSDISACGFSNTHASAYWGPWQGHLGMHFFVFSAVRA